jgi:hypothetical protein
MFARRLSPRNAVGTASKGSKGIITIVLIIIIMLGSTLVPRNRDKVSHIASYRQVDINHQNFYFKYLNHNLFGGFRILLDLLGGGGDGAGGGGAA